ncbi:MAG: 30S ribosomal protein S3 [Ktedonobacteraceae bacterium]
MGHKVHPIGFRLGIVKDWQSRWYAERDYKDLFAEDFKLRKAINKELANASVSHIEIERAAANQVAVTIHTAKPGIVIGRSGEKVDKLRVQLEALTKKRVRLNIVEIRTPELDAILVGRSIAEQLEKRVSFRRAMKQAVQKTMRANAKGIRVLLGGRLGGADIARSEKEVEGKVPLHTLRADIDYGLTEAHTTFGVIGIKVWIYKGDILPSKRREQLGEMAQEATTFVPQRDERGPRPGGDRGPRPQGGDRGPRPQGGDRGPRPQGGERAPRPPRPVGDRPQGGAPVGDRPQGERAPRAPRPMGERPARPPRAPRPEAQSPVVTSETGATPPPPISAAPETSAPESE